MKRSPVLEPLSRDHHQALVVAQRLRRASPETAAEVRERFLDFWRSEQVRHFRVEEEVLLPAYAGHGDPGHPLVVRVLVDHVEIRHRADRLARNPSPPIEALQRLGSKLAEHVRLEERELFPLIEAALPDEELEPLCERIAAAESAAGA